MKHLKTTIKYIRRTPYQSMAAILTMFLTLLLTGFFALLSIVSVIMLEYFEKKPQITVFFTDRATKKDADELSKIMMDTGKVISTKFVTKEEALVLYKEQNKNDPLLLEMVTAEILPASLEITTIKPEYLGEIEPLIKKNELVDEVVYQKDVVESLIKWTRAVRIILGILIVIMAITALLVITTITSMKIAIRKEEIEILELVGASPWYIKAPLVIEGGIYGIIGAFLSFLIILTSIIVSKNSLLSFMGSIPAINDLLNPIDSLFIIYNILFCLALVSVGFLIGSFGSYLAANRFLKH